MTEQYPFNEKTVQIAVSNEHSVPVESVTIENLKISPGSKKGDGFACLIAALDFVAIVNGQKYEKHYIAKYADDEARKAILKRMAAFEREGLNYTYLIPALQKLRESRGLKKLSFADCFYASAEESVLILDNLKMKGFGVIKKQPEPLTLDAIRMVLSELAAFHATGYVFYKTHPDGKEKLAQDYPYIFTNRPLGGVPEEVGQQMLGQMMNMCAPMVMTFVEVMRDEGETEVAEKMMKFVPTLGSIVKELFGGDLKDGLITHNDAWFNNFLFKYSGQGSVTPAEIALIDLQGTQLGRLGVELAYFLISSTSPQQREHHLDDILHFYYDTFCNELTNLGHDGKPHFSFEDMLQDFNACYAFGFTTGCLHTQALLFTEDCDLTFNIEAFGDGPDAFNMLANMLKELVLTKVKNDPKFKSLVTGLIKEAESRKLF